jgi:integrase/recombinase XerD
MQATARIFILKAPAKMTLDGRHPVKLAITHKGQRKYYSLKDKIKDDSWLFISKDDIKCIWPPLKNGSPVNPRGIFRDIRNEYDRIAKGAEGIIEGIPVFSFGQFEEKFLHSAGNWDNVFTAMVDHIQALKLEGRLGYASSFESTLRAVKEFHTGKKMTYTCREKVDTRYKDYLSGKALSFVDITPTWLTKFEKALQKKKNSKSTIGIYIRNIRVIFNLATKKHGVKAAYPFNEYTPKSASGRKLALSAHQIALINNYQTENPREQFYRDMFMFSFLANGLNLSDVARLKYSNIDDDSLYVVREKTKNKDEQTELVVPITRQMQDIINNHGSRAVGHDAYIFPVLTPARGEQANYAEIKQFVKMVNKHLRNIAKAVKITEKISSYTARHSWATISKNSGASTEYIKESLGHSNVLVTEKYLKSFESDTRRKHSESIEKQISLNPAM